MITRFVLGNLDIFMVNFILIFYLDVPADSVKFWVSLLCIATCSAFATYYNTKNK